MDQARHKRLSKALCEAVEFGTPQVIRLGNEDFESLVDSLGALYWDKLEHGPLRFEDVRLSIEPDRHGCVVEHDSRYVGIFADATPVAVPDTVAVDRSTRKPVVVAW